MQEGNEEDDEEDDDDADDDDDDEEEEGFQMVDPALNQALNEAEMMMVGEEEEFADNLPTEAMAVAETGATSSNMADIDSDGGTKLTQ